VRIVAVVIYGVADDGGSSVAVVVVATMVATDVCGPGGVEAGGKLFGVTVVDSVVETEL